jgi:hypothetical protein
MTKPRIVFAPGCFDGFKGTQQELDLVLAEIERLFANGTLPEGARKLSESEVEEIANRQIEPRQ